LNKHSSIQIIVDTFFLQAGTEDFKYVDSTIWPQLYPISCGGQRQSPIDIDVSKCITRTGRAKRRLKISGWHDIPSITKVFNTGKTVEIWNEYTGTRPQMTGGPFGSEVYEFHQVHFHWGRNDL
jgi:carbonic anhydrase